MPNPSKAPRKRTTPSYSKVEIDKMIAKDKRISKKEAKLIHRLLKGRHG
jgi:hypothetical protein